MSRLMYFFSPQWDGGRPAALDVTVISSLQALTVADAAVFQGSALSVTEARKQALHAAACHQVGVSFFPLAVEVLGGWSPMASSIIRSIGRLGRDPTETIRHLFQRLSVTLWRGNAAMHVVCMCSAAAPPPSIDGYYMRDSRLFFFVYYYICLFIVHCLSTCTVLYPPPPNNNVINC